MKIAFPSAGNELSAMVDGRFGRAVHYVIVDSDSGKIISVIANTAVNASGGAGIEASQLLINEGINIVVAMNVGPNAFKTLQGAKIQLFMAINGSIQENFTKYKANELNPVSAPSRGSRGSGGGMGRGRR